MPPFTIRPMNGPEDIAAAQRLLRQYHDGMREDRCFVRFEQEIRNLPGDYIPPHGEFLLACIGNEAVGCVALKPMATPHCSELKRFFVHPEFRGQGIGLALFRAIIGHAYSVGYREIRLDTIPTLEKAIAMYRQHGFVEVEPWVDPVPSAVLFMALHLEPPDGV